MSYPKGLIRYTTQNSIDHKKNHLLRPRVLIYGSLLILALIGLGTSLVLRTPLELDIIRDRNMLYRDTVEGLVENVYTLKILNMGNTDLEYRLDVDGIDDLRLIADQNPIRVLAGEVVTFPVSLQVDPVHLTSTSSDVSFHLEAVDQPDIAVTEQARFVGPVLR